MKHTFFTMNLPSSIVQKMIDSGAVVKYKLKTAKKEDVEIIEVTKPEFDLHIEPHFIIDKDGNEQIFE